MNDTMRILIGYDGSDCAEAALDNLRQAGLPSKADALVLSVAEVWLPPPASSANDIVDQAREAQMLGDREPDYAKASATSLAARCLDRCGRGDGSDSVLSSIRGPRAGAVPGVHAIALQSLRPD